MGGPGGWTEDVSSVVASRIADKGRIVTIAAGNGESLVVSDMVRTDSDDACLLLDGAEGSWVSMISRVFDRGR